MRDDLARWQEGGVTVALIGNGTPEFATRFREDFDFRGRLLVDPDLVAYRAARLRRGSEAIVSRGMFRDVARALRAGARQEGIQGDPWQLGGAFVFREGGALLLSHRNVSAGDHVSAASIDAALEQDEPVEEGPAPVSRFASVSTALRPILDASPVGSFDRLGFARHSLGFDADDLDVDLRERHVVVTGANSGIGLATSLALADLGARVTAVCRDEERGRQAVELIRSRTGSRRVALLRADLSDLSDVERASGELAKEGVDVLVHNAGVLPSERGESAEGLELTFATHIAGPHLMTARLRPALEASADARVIWVSSGGMLTTRLRLDDPQWRARPYDGVRAYAETKRAQVVLSELWATEFRDTGIKVHAMHPGWADTPAVASSLPRFHQLTRAILRTPAEGADTVVWLAASERGASESGRFYFDRSAVRTHWLPSTLERDGDRDRLWRLCGGATPNRSEAYGLGARSPSSQGKPAD